MAVGVDELEFLQDSPLVYRRPRPSASPTQTFGEEPPPGSLGAYYDAPALKSRPRRVLVPSPTPVFFGPPHVEPDIIFVIPSPSTRYRQRTRTSYFPEYPVPTLYRNLEALQIPNNPYARLHRHVIKAIIYMRTTYVGEPTL